MRLSPQIQKLIDERVRSGKYQTAEDVMAAALTNLEQQEQAGDLALFELEKLLAEGERSGDALNGESVFAEVRDLR